MKKWVNLRPPVVFCAGLICGILYGALLAYRDMDGIFCLYPPVGLLALSAFFAVKGNKSLFRLFFGAAIFFAFGAVYFYARYVAFSLPTVNLSSAVSVTGRVTQAGYTTSGENFIVLENVTLNGKSVGGKMYAYFLYDIGKEYGVGYNVAFYCNASREDFFSNGSITYRACEDVRYFGYILGAFTSKYRFSLFASVNRAISSALYSSLDKETASVCLGMLTGNTSAISFGTLNAFRSAGIAHIFAVSGLHIGVIYGCLSAIFKRLRVNRYVSAAVKISAILFYSGVCGFSSSSVRAVVMCSVSAISGCLNRKYDPLNAIALAALIILIIDPFQLFNAGFILSFLAMLGIALLSFNVKMILYFLPEKLREALSVTLSAQLFTTPAQVCIFGGVSHAGLLLNIVFIPLFSALYVVIFVCAMLSAAIPYVAPALLPVACAPVQLVINAVVYFGFNNAVISAEADALLIFYVFAVAATVTDKFNLGMRLRLMSLFSVCAASLVCVVGADSGYSGGTTVQFTAAYSGGYCLISNHFGSVLVVTQDVDSVEDFALDDVDSLIIVGGDFSTACIYRIEGDFSEVYVCADCAQYPPTGNYKIVQDNSFSLIGVQFAFTKNSLIAEAEGVRIAVAYNVEEEAYLSAMPKGCICCLYSFDGDPAALIYGGKQTSLTRSPKKYLLKCSGVISLA